MTNESSCTIVILSVAKDLQLLFAMSELPFNYPPAPPPTAFEPTFSGRCCLTGRKQQHE